MGGGGGGGVGGGRDLPQGEQGEGEKTKQDGKEKKRWG